MSVKSGQSGLFTQAVRDYVFVLISESTTI